MNESLASLPSLSTLEPKKGDGILSWFRSLNFSSLAKRFCGNYGLRAAGRILRYGYSVVHQYKQLGSMDIQQSVAASVVKIGATAIEL